MAKSKLYRDGSGPVEILHVSPQPGMISSILLTAWLVVWTAAGAFAIQAVYPDVQSATLVFLLFWAVADVWIAYLVAWLWFGDEILSVEDGRLERALRLGPWVRRRLYDRAQISNLQPVEIISSRGRSLSGRDWSIQFNEGARRRRIGRNLTEDESRTVATWLSERLGLGAPGEH
jgi:hypothetical protein